MIRKRSFALLPTPLLAKLLSGTSTDNLELSGELIVRKLDSRHLSSREDAVALLKTHYPKVFASHHLPTSNLGYEQLRQHIEVEGFENLWQVAIFDDCEDIEDLMADVNSGIH